MKLIYLFLGGGLGSVARYMVSGWSHRIMGDSFPWGTLSVNVIGSLLIGLLWGYFEMRNIGPGLRMFLFVGFLGGFTTFSTFALETMNLLRSGEMKMALVSIFANNLLAFLFVFAGFISSSI